MVKKKPRTVLLKTLVTRAEERTAKARARAAGKSVSSLLRDLLLGVDEPFLPNK